MAQTVAALYKDVRQAHRVIKALTDAGFEHKAISMVAPDPEGKYGEIIEAGPREEEGRREAAAEGAMIGGAIGAVAGLLFGLSAFTIPGLGPILVAGPLYTTVFGAGAGGLSGGLIGALVDAGIPRQEASYYREGIRRGHTLVAVSVNQQERPSAVHIMKAHDPLELETAEKEWRASGWKGPDKTPEQFEPEHENEEDEHQYATGAMGSDLTGPEASRNQPPLPTHREGDDS